MTDNNQQFLDAFDTWLANLGQDVQTVHSALWGGVGPDVQRLLAGGINYLFKSLDLIPDGIDDIGYLDDAFVLRTAARLACDTDVTPLTETQRADLGRLAEDTALIRQFLDTAVYDRLVAYVRRLADGSARGRMVADILDNADVRRDFDTDVADFIRTYQRPEFTKDPKTLIKLKAFLEAKLPA